MIKLLVFRNPLRNSTYVRTCRLEIKKSAVCKGEEVHPHVHLYLTAQTFAPVFSNSRLLVRKGMAGS